MKSTTIRVTATLILLTLLSTEVYAWGPRSSKAIAGAALSVIRREFDDAFKAGSITYDVDLLRGAEDGIAVIRGDIPLDNDAHSLAAINHEIQLLRDTREFGTGSYFAYRMGVLSVLVSSVIIPYGLPYTPEDERIAARVDQDLDAHVSSYTFTIRGANLTYLRSVPQYFQESRNFFDDDRRLIADDYTRGRGYRGFLGEAGQAYFNRSVQAVADAWFTVLRSQGAPNDIDTSPRILARYFVNEIRYLLEVKKNYQQAVRTYEVFDRVNPDLMPLYEEIGDYFYAFATEARGTEDANRSAIQRAVREWERAYGHPGPQRPRAGKKLAAHFISEGNALFRKASTPEGADTDLEDALRMYQRALEFERSNDVAAGKINETTVAIAEKRQRFEMQQSVIDKALTVKQQAEQMRLAEVFGNAIDTYNQARILLDVIDAEFPRLEQTAVATREEILREINNIEEEVLKRGRNLISQGDEALDTNRFDDAVGFYEKVEPTLSVINPERTRAQRKQELIDEALTKISDAKLAKENFERDQQAAGAALPPPRNN